MPNEIGQKVKNILCWRKSLCQTFLGWPNEIGQKVKIVNLPSYFEMYNQEGFIIPIDYNIMSYQTRHYPYKKK